MTYISKTNPESRQVGGICRSIYTGRDGGHSLSYNYQLTALMLQSMKIQQQ